MSSLPDELSPALAQQRAELAELILRYSPHEGFHPTSIGPLTLIRGDRPTDIVRGVHQPALCVIAQGRKMVSVGERDYYYDPLHLLVVSVAVPVSGRVLEASPEQPFLCVRIDIDPAQIANLLAETGPLGVVTDAPRSSMFVERMEGCLLDALLRLVRLLDTPQDVAMLAPLALREIFYRLLSGRHGQRLHEIAIADSQTHRVTRAIEWLNLNYTAPLRIDDLARSVNLSTSTLHHRFKEFTAMSPLQFQKQLRLQEARRLMLGEGLEAAVAGYRVGYESASQFSREYSRLFGAPPSRDLARLRSSA